MAIDISKLFSDIAGPANTDLAEGQARLNAMDTPGGMAALLYPQRSRAMRQGLGGLFGNPAGGMTPQEQIPEAMRGLDINDPNSIAMVIRKLNAIGATREASQLKLGLDQLLAENANAAAKTAALTANAAANTSQAEQQVLRTPAYISEADSAALRAKNQTEANATEKDKLTLAEARLDFDEEDQGRYRGIQEEQNRLEGLRIDAMNTNLTNQDKTLINDAVNLSIEAQEDGRIAIQMAAKFERLNPLAGIRGSAFEGWKSFMGTGDEVSLMKTEFTGFVNKLMVQGLPPGVASDKDIAMVQAGFPDASYNPEQIQRYMRGLAKVSFINAALESAKATYAVDNAGSLAGFQDEWNKIRNDSSFISGLEEQHGVNFITEGEADDIDDSLQGQAALIMQRRAADRASRSNAGDPFSRNR